MKYHIYIFLIIIAIILALIMGGIAKVQKQIWLLDTISFRQYAETHRCDNGNKMWVDREYEIRCDREIVNK
jgi:hypothetical protein